MILTAKQRSKKVREEAERRGRDQDAAVPLQRRIAEHICAEINGGFGKCACANSPTKPYCAAMDATARWVIDTVRNHDARVNGQRMHRLMSEPTQAELEAACRAFHSIERPSGAGVKVMGWDDYSEGVRNQCRREMTKALIAAAEVRQQQERA